MLRLSAAFLIGGMLGFALALAHFSLLYGPYTEVANINEANRDVRVYRTWGSPSRARELVHLAEDGAPDTHVFQMDVASPRDVVVTVWVYKGQAVGWHVRMLPNTGLGMDGELSSATNSVREVTLFGEDGTEAITYRDVDLDGVFDSVVPPERAVADPPAAARDG